MRYKLLGRSGLKVSEICLGTMTFGTEFGWGATKKESQKVFDLFVAQGGNFFDTANYYTKGTSEVLLGEFMGDKRERYVVGTKYTLNNFPNDPNAGGNHRKNMMQSLEASLKRLKVDYVDIYWVHAWDIMTPIDEVMRALDDMVRAGKILYVGISDMPAWLVSRANTMAELRNWTPCIALQLEYSLIERTIEREFFPMARNLGLSITAWSPLGGGMLTGKYLREDAISAEARYTKSKNWGERVLTEKNAVIAEEVISLSQETGYKPAQIALNWIMQKNQQIIPIIGAKNEAQLLENLGSLDFHLTDEQMSRLDEVSKIELGFPNEFLAREDLKRLVHGDTFNAIDRV